MRWGIVVAAGLLLTLSLTPVSAVGEVHPDYTPQSASDNAPPEASIERSQFRTATATVRFWFSASEPAQGFLCQLDQVAFKPCGPPRTYKHLKPGRHAFRVKAVDVAGNVGPPALARFKIPRPQRRRR